MEYLSEFPQDSAGFFKRSLLDTCVSKVPNEFYLELEGEKGARYFMGIDPARNHDALAIVILKLVGEQMRLVRVMTYEKTPFPEIAEVIRKLLREYNIEMIGMDKGGGGLTLKDLLENPMTATAKSDIILDMDDELNMAKEGRKILRMVDFYTAWISDANFDMRSSFEHKKLMLPCYDSADTFVKPKIDLNDKDDIAVTEYFNTIEEITSIVMTATKSGSLHFDTLKQGARKDRYSAILIAHKILYDLIRSGYQKQELGTGGFLGSRFGDEAKQDEWKETITLEEIQERALEIHKKGSLSDGALI